MKIEIINNGIISIVVGRDKNRLPIVIHPRKSMFVDAVVAEKLIKNNKAVEEKDNKAVEEKDNKPLRKKDTGAKGSTGKVF